MANATKKKFSFVNIVFFVIFGVLTGVLWAYLCPIPLIPAQCTSALSLSSSL